jgi:anaerobic selenocysteine-containing dehydrogenase
MPPELLEVLAAEERPDAPYTPLEGRDREEPDGDTLLLIPYRLSTLSSGTLFLERWMAERPSVLPGIEWDPWVEVSPETAHHLGLEDGNAVDVVSERARLRARLKVSPGTAPGTVCFPYRLRHRDGSVANPLRLLNDEEDPLTGLRSWFSTTVRLENA